MRECLSFCITLTQSYLILLLYLFTPAFGYSHEIIHRRHSPDTLCNLLFFIVTYSPCYYVVTQYITVLLTTIHIMSYMNLYWYKNINHFIIATWKNMQYCDGGAIFVLFFPYLSVSLLHYDIWRNILCCICGSITDRYFQTWPYLFYH